jgi:CRISPR-associated endonuclease/helicase Cas3
MLSEFAARAGASIVLCTATQPAWNRREGLEEGFASVHEIAPPEMRLFDKLLRVTVAWPNDGEAAWQWPQVAERMLEESQVLCIVNTKGAVREVHAELKNRGADDALHLSTNMCPRHRLETIDEVRRRLRAGEPCRLVSTQLIEAGVDVDFPVVLREMSPLEAIIQAAGRANREGLLNLADGTPGGRVVVFRAAKHVKLDRWYESGIGVVEAEFLRAGRRPDIARPEDVAEYFRRLYRSGNLDAKNIQTWREALSFEEVAKSYRLIDDATFPVVIATWKKAQNEVEEVLDQLRAGWNRRLSRRLSPYIVNVRYAQAEQYAGLIAEGPVGMKVWWGPYDEQIGMSSETQADWWVV